LSITRLFSHPRCQRRAASGAGLRLNTSSERLDPRMCRPYILIQSAVGCQRCERLRPIRWRRKYGVWDRVRPTATERRIDCRTHARTLGLG
jgi:hypothetical protein